MIKIGILICGQPRCVDYFNWNISNVFSKIDDYDFEIYSFTWDAPATNLSNYKIIEFKNQLDIMLPIYERILKYNNSNRISKSVFKNHYNVKRDCKDFCSTLGQIVGCYEAYQLAKNTDINYFIKVRTDMVFDPTSMKKNIGNIVCILDRIKNSNQPGVVIPISKVFKGHGIIGDWWWAVDRISITQLFENFYERLELLHTTDNLYLYNVLNKPSWQINHDTLSSWLNYNGCHTIDFNYYNNNPLKCILLRNNCQKINADQIYKLGFQDWEDMYYEVQPQVCVSPADNEF